MLRLPRHHTTHDAPSASRRRISGQSLVEFALVLPVLMLILLITIDFGRVFLGWVELNNAARIGANFAANHPNAWGTPGNSTDAATYKTLIGNDAAAINCTLPNPVPIPTFPDGSVLGGRSQVDLTCQFSLITPFLGECSRIRSSSEHRRSSRSRTGPLPGCQSAPGLHRRCRMCRAPQRASRRRPATARQP